MATQHVPGNAGQQLRVRAYFADVPDTVKLDCFRETANVLLTAGNLQLLPVTATLEEATGALASFWPPTSVPNRLTGLVLEVAEGAKLVYIPHAIRAAAPSIVAGTGVQVQVDTVEATERRERILTVGTFKFPRRSEAPWTFLYPHHWVEMLVSSTPAIVYDSWLRQLQAMFTSHSCQIPEMHGHKYKTHLLNVTLWLQLVPANATINDVPSAMMRMWFNNIELIIELFLLGVRLNAPAGVATAKFTASVEAKWHSGEALDYYKLIQEAREVKDTKAPAPKNSPGPTGGGNYSFRRIN
jgi:hypothetical protein